MTIARDKKKVSCPAGRKRNPALFRKAINRMIATSRPISDDRFNERLFHEIIPILVVSEYLNALCVTFTEENAPIDGFITTKHTSDAIEIVSCVDNLNYRLIEEHEKKYGYQPPLTEKMERPRNKSEGRVKRIEPRDFRARDIQQYDENDFKPRLQQKLEIKIKKAKKNYQYKNALLGIVFDDYISIQDHRYKERRFNSIFTTSIDRYKN